MPEPIEEIGKRIKALREARGWSQDKLGKEAGTTHVTIGNTEKGSHPVNLKTFLAIAKALEVKASDLIRTGPSAVPEPKQVLVGDILNMDDSEVERLGPTIRALIDSDRRFNRKQDGKKVDKG